MLCLFILFFLKAVSEKLPELGNNEYTNKYLSTQWIHVSNAATKWQGHGIRNNCIVVKWMNYIVLPILLYYFGIELTCILGNVNWVAQVRPCCHILMLWAKERSYSPVCLQDLRHTTVSFSYLPSLRLTLSALISYKNLPFTVFMTHTGAQTIEEKPADNRTAWNQLQARGWLEPSEIQLRKTSRQ